MAIAKKYPSGGTGGWNPQFGTHPQSRVVPFPREYLKTLPNPQPQVEPVEENSIRDTDMQPIDKGSSLIGTIKEKKWIVLGLVAVAGFFAYKKFKK